MSSWTEVFLSLGGNIGDTKAVFRQATHLIQKLPKIENLVFSRYYTTSPVSTILQQPYTNAVCRLQSALSAQELLGQLQNIESRFGKSWPAKQVNAPRVLDIDILFFGQQQIREKGLQIPHPRWRERLFVLAPLRELERYISIDGRVEDIQSLLDHFPYYETQWVSVQNEGYL